MRTEIQFDIFQNDFKQYLEDYTTHIFGIALTLDNLDKIFSHEPRNERHMYPLYFYYMINDDYLNYYLSTGKQGYIKASIQILNWMNNSLLYNDYLLDNIITQINGIYDKYVTDDIEGVFLGKDAPDTVHGAKKFFWSFVSSYLND